jgi:opacity protein-like surface antigen
MKIKFICLFIILITNISFAQTIFIGGNGTIGFSSPNSLPGVGLSINTEYQPIESQFSYRLSAKVYNAEFDPTQLYLATHTHTLKTIECNVLYTPFKGMIQPYLGVGLGYNLVNIDLSGNLRIIDSKFATTKNPKNTFNYNIVLGTSFYSEIVVSIFIDLLYRIMNVDYEVELEDQYRNKSLLNRDVNLNNLLLNVGIRIRL